MSGCFIFTGKQMIMQLKIFIGDKPVYLTDTLNDVLKSKIKNKAVLFIEHPTGSNKDTLITGLQNGKTEVILYGNDFDELRKSFFEQFEVIEAAGGIVQNDNKAILFILRRGKWDLPKGKLEAGESVEECAAREIEEETGISNLLLKRKVGETYHVYTEKDKEILKISHWFYFTCSAKQKLRPQTEEDIDEVKWVTTQQIRSPMQNTYENIRDIMHTFFDTP